MDIIFVIGTCALSCACLLCPQVHLLISWTSASEQTTTPGSFTDNHPASVDPQRGVLFGTTAACKDFRGCWWSRKVRYIHSGLNPGFSSVNFTQITQRDFGICSKEVLCTFLKLLFTKNQRITRIEQFHGCITTAVTLFLVSAQTAYGGTASDKIQIHQLFRVS